MAKNTNGTTAAAAKAKTAAKAKAAAATTAAVATEPKFSIRSRFTSSTGSKLDIQLKQTPKGYRTAVTLRLAKNGDEKVKADRGMVTLHDTQALAQARFDELVAAAGKEGWSPSKTTTRQTFSVMPKAV